MVQSLRNLRAHYFPDPTVEPDTEHLFDTDAVDMEAAIASAGEDLEPEICTEVYEFYRHCLARYEYVKEANDKFLSMLEDALDEDLSDPTEQVAIRAYAESLLLDPITQPMIYDSYLEEDMVDEAEDLTNREAWMDINVMPER
ncbi:MAG: hypothetical protein IGS48_17825 [Oscillatoriales cyanobacterium C42_A2020_001]|nr:hypothetical protein [Leptolyngbyaceae cyanobacterium C42_A2020_001]